MTNSRIASIMYLEMIRLHFVIFHKYPADLKKIMWGSFLRTKSQPDHEYMPNPRCITINT